MKLLQCNTDYVNGRNVWVSSCNYTCEHVACGICTDSSCPSDKTVCDGNCIPDMDHDCIHDDMVSYTALMCMAA